MTIPPNPPPIPQQPLDYRGGRGSTGGPAMTPAAGYRPHPSIFSAIRFVAAIAVMLILLAIFFFVIPQLEAVYADFGTKLPAITQIVLDVSRFLHTPLGWIVAIIITGIVALADSVLPIPARWLRLLVVLLLALIVIALALALFLPIVNLMDSISGGGTGKK